MIRTLHNLSLVVYSPLRNSAFFFGLAHIFCSACLDVFIVEKITNSANLNYILAHNIFATLLLKMTVCKFCIN